MGGHERDYRHSVHFPKEPGASARWIALDQTDTSNTRVQMWLTASLSVPSGSSNRDVRKFA
jgi:hypothetical protein